MFLFHAQLATMEENGGGEKQRQRAPLVSYVFRRRLLGEDTLQMRLKVVQENSESFCSSCILSVVSCNFNISSWARSAVQHAATTCSNWPGSQEYGQGGGTVRELCLGASNVTFDFIFLCQLSKVAKFP